MRSTDKNKRALELWNQGLSRTVIAIRLGCSSNTVSKIITAHLGIQWQKGQPRRLDDTNDPPIGGISRLTKRHNPAP
jgi:transposase